MSFMFTVSPDFKPEYLSGWYIFNTWLQRESGLGIHLEMYNDFQTQWAALEKDEIDLVYATPYAASMLVREKGFSPLVKPVDDEDETVIVVSVDCDINDVVDLKEGAVISSTISPGVNMMGMIMLEPADLDLKNTKSLPADTYVIVARNIITGKADAGIFLAEAYDDLSNLTKKQLKVLVRSQIGVIHHSLMIGPKLLDKKAEIQKILLDMSQSEKGLSLLKGLGFSGFLTVENEEMEFMIDLIDTLTI